MDTASEPTPRSRLAASAVALAALVVLAWWAYATTGFWNATTFQNDVRQQAYFFDDPVVGGAFEGDPITAYMRHYLPPVYRGLMEVASDRTDAVAAGKKIHFVLFAVCVGSLWVLGYRAGGIAGGFAAALIPLASGFMHDRLASGLPRGFGYPVIFVALAGLAYRSWHVVGFAMAVGAAFYPPVVLIFAPCAAATAIQDGGLRAWKGRRRALAGAAAWGLIIAAALAAAWNKPDWIGRPFTLKEAFSMPEYGPNGRFLDEIAWFRGNGAPGLSIPFLAKLSWMDRGALASAAAAALALAVAGFRRRDGFVFTDGRLYLTFLGACAAAYGISYAFAFRLFFPDRAILYGLLPLLWIAAGVFPSVAAGAFFADRRKAGAAALAAVVVVMAVSDSRVPRDTDNYQRPPEEILGVVAAARRLPPDAVLAGAPLDLDWFPLLAKRRAYVNHETAHPLFTGYTAEMRRRYAVLIDLFYATDKKAFRKLAAAEGITHMVVTKVHYAPDRRSPRCFEPHEAAFKRARERGDGPWVVFPPPQSATIYESDRFALVEVAKL